MKKLSIIDLIRLYVACLLGVLALLAPALSQAATFTNFTGTAGNGYPGIYSARSYVLKSSLVITNGQIASNDVIQTFGISSGSLVRAVGYRTTIAPTNANVTFKIGDGDNTAGWVSSGVASNGWNGSSYPSFQTLTLTGTVQGVAVVTNITPSYSLGKQYTANDTLDIIFNLTPQIAPNKTARFDFWAEVVDGTTP